ncbi:hypothetical protein [Paenibacillus mendelii]|uniref:Sporulation protein YjcZ n=1 Tax=Paenibacillus mendelii TaxID=206163 RepID=A0ABV6J7J6_9BACL|nr:hypothetical protein [Paenibacillus mendelii]MCQ6560414.1 hypothetical protein [Paenibacillus mendelii]
MGYPVAGGAGCGPVGGAGYGPVGGCNIIFSSTGVILVLFILLVIILRCGIFC